MEVIKVNQVWQLAEVYLIRIQTFVQGQHIPIDLEFDEKYGETYFYTLLRNNKQGLATARINLDNRNFAKIERVAVLPEFQHQGLGKKLIQTTETFIRQHGYTKIVITSQTHAVPFYQALGYTINEAKTKELISSIPIVYTEKIL